MAFRIEKAVIPLEKLTKYALNPERDPDKALAFKLALGYDKNNAEKLIENIMTNLSAFSIKNKGDNGYGAIYEVVMELKGENGKTANVLTGWFDDVSKDELRLVTVHITKKKGVRND